MKTNLKLLGVFAIFAMVSCDIDPDTPPEPPLVAPIKIELSSVEKEIVTAEKQNTVQIFSKLLEQENEKSNLMISPFSLNMALTMAWNGAKGETQEAIEKALGYKPEYREALNAYHKKMGESFVKTDPRTALVIGNSMWYRDTIKLKKEFGETLEKSYYAFLKGVDFADERTANLMNEWIKRMTGESDNIIEKTSSEDVMYLMNTLFFRGKWSEGFAFKTADTKQEDFTIIDGSKVKVPMMHQEKEMDYQENTAFSAVKLPYGNGAYSMVVLLPKVENSVEQMFQKILGENTLDAQMTKFQKATVNLFLPKFKFNSDIVMNGVLQAMGMEKVFANDADFSEAFENLTAHISKVRQVAGILVDEVGTKGSAVTVVDTVGTVSAKSDKVDFTVDRPFAFVIQENSTGSILFMGKVGNPNK